VDTLRRLEGTNLFVLPKRFEPDARLDYKLVINARKWILDPRNPRICTGGFGPNSELAMPAYVPADEIRFNPAVPRGALDTLAFHSSVLNNDRRLAVYLPPSYAEQLHRNFPSLFVMDGGEYLSLGSMATVLDNTIHANRMDAVIAVFVDPVGRNREYWANPDFRRMLCDELVPWIDSRYRTLRDPRRRAVFGASLGGLTALDVLVNRPDVFGLAASQSGAFWVDDAAMVGRVQGACLKGSRIYLDWGSYESEIPEINRRILDILESKGATVHFGEFHEGHSWGSWRARLDDALMFLFPG
jgi:enterochelin esterase family protein